MIELAGLDFEVADDIAQAYTTGKLRQAETDELRSAGHFAQFLALMVLPSQGLEFMSRD